MDQPKVAANAPFKCELQQGKKYAWCTCGLSQNQPFCDGGHAGTEFKPIVFEADESKEVWFCQCKQSKNGPWCDGAHNDLANENSG